MGWRESCDHPGRERCPAVPGKEGLRRSLTISFEKAPALILLLPTTLRETWTWRGVRHQYFLLPGTP